MAVAADRSDAYRRATLFFFNKALRTHGASQLLFKFSFIEDGVVLRRTLFELHMQLEWMSRDASERAQNFLDHFPVRFYDLHRRKGGRTGLAVFPAVHGGERHAHKFSKLGLCQTQSPSQALDARPSIYRGVLAH